jgi:hypothetical protein
MRLLLSPLSFKVDLAKQTSRTTNTTTATAEVTNRATEVTPRGETALDNRVSTPSSVRTRRKLWNLKPFGAVKQQPETPARVKAQRHGLFRRRMISHPSGLNNAPSKQNTTTAAQQQAWMEFLKEAIHEQCQNLPKDNHSTADDDLDVSTMTSAHPESSADSESTDPDEEDDDDDEPSTYAGTTYYTNDDDEFATFTLPDEYDEFADDSILASISRLLYCVRQDTGGLFQIAADKNKCI